MDCLNNRKQPKLTGNTCFHGKTKPVYASFPVFFLLKVTEIIRFRFFRLLRLTEIIPPPLGGIVPVVFSGGGWQ